MGEKDVGGGIDSRSGFGGLILIGLILVGAIACVVSLALTDSIEDSRASRAQSHAAAERAAAGARAAEARAEVDKVQIQADSELALQVERHEHELAALRQQNREFQEKLLLYAVIVERLDKQELARLEARLGTGEIHTPWWGYLAAALLAVWVFILALLGLRLWQSLRGRRVYYE